MILMSVLAVGLCQSHCQNVSFSRLGDDLSLNLTLSTPRNNTDHHAGCSQIHLNKWGRKQLHNRPLLGITFRECSDVGVSLYNSAWLQTWYPLPLPRCNVDIADGKHDFGVSETNTPQRLHAKTISQDSHVMLIFITNVTGLRVTEHSLDMSVREFLDCHQRREDTS